MSFRRYEILLPIRYNDGSEVEPRQFWETAKELVERFGALTCSREPVRGIWTHQGRSFEDDNVRLYVDVEDTPENAAFFASYKSKLKRRFRQVDIWLVSFQIEIIE